MSWIGNLLGTSVDKVIGSVGGIIDDLNTSDEEKSAAKLELQKLLQTDRNEIQETLRSELAAKERVLVAELNQDDAYTKRARPTVVYMGLLFILFNYVIYPASNLGIEALALPTEFWVAWGGIVGTWSIGRSAEKVGIKNKLTNAVTGSKPTMLD